MSPTSPDPVQYPAARCCTRVYVGSIAAPPPPAAHPPACVLFQRLSTDWTVLSWDAASELSLPCPCDCEPGEGPHYHHGRLSLSAAATSGSGDRPPLRSSKSLDHGGGASGVGAQQHMLGFTRPPMKPSMSVDGTPRPPLNTLQSISEDEA